MVHALAIAAAATAGVSVAIAFELAVFKPWRDENWPDGVTEGVRSELQKLRDDFGLAVSEIREDVRSLRDQRRARQRRAERLRDDELDDFRQGVGEEHSVESGQHGFEMHEREAEAYRDRLRASFVATHIQQYGSDAGLRRRRSRTTDPIAPHHSVGNLSPSMTEDAALTELQPAVSAVSEDLAGLTFAPASSSSTLPDEAPVTEVDGSTSSWTEAFDMGRASANHSDAHSTGSDTPGSNADHPPDHMALETNGLSRTLSDQHSFHQTHGEHEFVLTSNAPSVLNQTSDEDYDAEHEGSAELEFETLSVGDSDGSSDPWSQLLSPSSPSLSGLTTDTDRDERALEHVLSEGESWSEISSPKA